jgi:hypothetical protein
MIGGFLVFVTRVQGAPLTKTIEKGRQVIRRLALLQNLSLSLSLYFVLP